MRLFNTGNRPEPDPEETRTDPQPVLTGDPSGDVTPDPDPVPQPEPLEVAYGEDGNALQYNGHPVYHDADGRLYDHDGNELVEGEPETETEPQPAPAPAPSPFRSPFADEVLNDDERAAAEQLVTPEAMRLIQTIAARTADRIVAAREQQRIVARELGIPADAYDALAPRISRMEQHVPQPMRGTKQGAMMAAFLAAGEEAMETGDFQGALRKLVAPSANTETPAPAPRTEAPRLPPSATLTTPRGSGPDNTRTERVVGPRDTANKSFQKDGLQGDVIAILRAERKAGGRR